MKHEHTKIVMVKASSIDEDLKVGTRLDAGKFLRLIELYGEDELIQYIMEDFKVSFKALDYKEIRVYGAVDKDDTIDDIMYGYCSIHAENGDIVLSSVFGMDNENYVRCSKVEVVENKHID